MNVLLIESDAVLNRGLRLFLQLKGYAVTAVATCAAAHGHLVTHRPDFVLLAPELPDGDGLQLLHGRLEYHASIFIVLTAPNQLLARLQAFDLGADECLSKPIAPVELERRMRTVARQRTGSQRSTIGFGAGFALDAAAYTVHQCFRAVPVTRSQFELLHCLLRHRGQTLTREQLRAALGEQAGGRPSNAIDVHVKNLRKVLGSFAPTDFLQTVHGVGYRLT